MKKFFTIITVVFEDRIGLEKTLESIVSQVECDYEVIVIDGGSRDGTLEIINKYQQIIKEWRSEKDRGTYDGMNKGVDLANSYFTVFLNAGDYFDAPYALAIAKKYIDSGHQGKLYFGRARIMDAKGRFWIYPDNNIEQTAINDWLKKCYPAHAACFFPTDFLKSNPYDMRFKITADSHLKRKAIDQMGYLFIPVVLSVFVTGGISNKVTLKSTLQIINERNVRHEFGSSLLDSSAMILKYILLKFTSVLTRDEPHYYIKKLRNFFKYKSL